MKIFDDITPALQSILRSWSTGSVVCWISFRVHRDKLPSIKEKWLEEYGTGLSSEKRRYKKSKGLPCASACAIPVLGMPHEVECIMLASAEALTAGSQSPFSREKWITRPPEVSDFVMVKEMKERGDSTWTWKINNKQIGMLERDLTALVKSSDGSAVAKSSHHMVRFYPMFSGVRRQLRRSLHSARKLWVANCKSTFPGPDPDKLPMMVGYRKESVTSSPKVAPIAKT